MSHSARTNQQNGHKKAQKATKRDRGGLLPVHGGVAFLGLIVLCLFVPFCGHSAFRVAAYMTEQPPRPLLERKWHDAITLARRRAGDRLKAGGPSGGD